MQEPNQVIEKYDKLHAHYERRMDRLKAGSSIDSTKRLPLEELKSISTDLGLPYKSADQLLQHHDLDAFARRLIHCQQTAKSLPDCDPSFVWHFT
ncbi:hypothetical protein [Brucella gallinifaecis]|uniref:hypothetical protein n=1 Tax=Brucella gallinifaecis TaxID=215590 RepID=UPI0023622927|nr:hypothetical protein [Brucella gallinifaecis]